MSNGYHVCFGTKVNDGKPGFFIYEGRTPKGSRVLGQVRVYTSTALGRQNAIDTLRSIIIQNIDKLQKEYNELIRSYAFVRFDASVCFDRGTIDAANFEVKEDKDVRKTRDVVISNHERMDLAYEYAITFLQDELSKVTTGNVLEPIGYPYTFPGSKYRVVCK